MAYATPDELPSPTKSVDQDGAMAVEETESDSPLMIEKILEIVLDHSCFLDLKNLRRVNSLWNAVASRVMDSRCRGITFGLHGYGLDDIPSFIMMLSHNWNFPCTTFKIDINFDDVDEDTLPMSGPEKQTVIIEFLQAVAPIVRHFELKDATGHGQPLFPTGAPPPDIQYPALETLTFDLPPHETHPPFQYHWEFVSNMVAHAPNLNDLQIGNTWRHGILNRFIPSVMERLISCGQLHKITLNGNLRDEHLARLKELGVRHLRSFTMDLCSPALTKEAVAQFLEAQSETLTKLVVVCSSLEHALFVHLPPLPHLTCLQIADPSTAPVTADEADFSSHLTIEQSFPALQKLELTFGMPRNLDTFFNPTVAPMERVVELELRRSLQHPAMIEEIARVLPNLRKLSMHALPELISVEHLEPLEKVEEWVVHCSRTSMDTLLTGYSAEELEQVKGLSERLLETLCRAMEPAPFLKRLRKLKIAGYGVGLSDLGCRLVLMNMEKLSCLDLEECRVTSPQAISTQILEIMRSKFTLLLGRRLH